MKKVILTGDRPTGKLHLGHYVGSLKKRVELQNSGLYDMYVMIADEQALADNARNPQKIRDSLLEVALDYLAVGIDPSKTTIFIQSQIPALYELTFHYSGFVHLGRLQRIPTLKQEIKERGFEKELPISWLTYPISQCADITAFGAHLVPVGQDQAPVVEIDREIVRAFNRQYGDILVEPEAVVPDGFAKRLPGLYGIDDKMSKSLDNAIYLSDSPEEVAAKVMKMYTDADHIRVEDAGKVEGNVVFIYLDVFAETAEQKTKVAELKEQYQKGGLGDVAVKKYLIEVLESVLAPIRQRRAEYEQDLDKVRAILRDGSAKADAVANQTLQKVREAIGLNYLEQ
ncbi:MAG: tryptophan--tRNA ligase [Candidatus Nomurabacteria bacterium]|jgi:tryptophanyl-tRNA synthetase|nr:tryptophan--tRNA ligase [Candidatus Nomurabacteria bacterium]